METYNFDNSNSKRIGRIILGSVVGVIILIVIVKTSVTIGSGEAGVLFRTFGGGVDLEKTYDEGFHIIAPWNKMFVYEVRQQSIKDKMSVLSSNGLEITIDVSIWFQPRFSELPKLHKEKSQYYTERVVQPAIRSATRSVIGRYTPEEVYSSKRDAIQTEINAETKKVLEKQYVQLNEVLVRDITLPPTIKQAIEAKLKQEQASQEYVYRIEKEKKEAERIRIEAEGKAQANQILNASLTDKILKEKGIQATLKLAESSNSKIVIVGNEDGLPLILGNN